MSIPNRSARLAPGAPGTAAPWTARGAFVLALGFGSEPESAARNALARLHHGFATARKDYIAGREAVARPCMDPRVAIQLNSN